MPRLSALLTIVLTVAATFGVWSLFTRTYDAPPMDGLLHGVTYTPIGKDQSSIRGDKPRVEQIERDMRTIAGRVRQIRTYSTLDAHEQIPRIADQYGIRVIAGAWVSDGETERTASEIAGLIRMANANANIERVMVGNEAVFRWIGDSNDKSGMNPAKIIRHIQHVKRNVKVPVSTAEPWFVWLRYPELARVVDYIAIHPLPYWDENSNEEHVAYLRRQIEEVRKTYPTKNIIVTEVGWPSNGASRISRGGTGDPVVKRASPALQAKNVRDAVDFLRREKVDHFVIEAFDQPWKSHDLEGMAGGYWGLWDADRQQKFDWTGPIVAFPEWWKLASWSLAVALPIILGFLWLWRGLKPVGELVFAGLTAAIASGMVYAVYAGFGIYMTTLQVVGWTFLLGFLLLSLVMVMSQALELVETIWTRRWKREVPLPKAVVDANRAWPKVSLHVAICNEPPAMVMQTLDSLAALDYPNFEVIVIDNNTRDPAVWRPVQDYCKTLGERFRFFHFDEMKGFKAGALNYVLSQTAPDAKIVAVIDSDYVVRKDWLRSLVPQFDNPKIGFVQAPQDHRDWRDDRFKEMLNWEYAGFFDIGMCLRNEYDAIIQHGTMTLVRRDLMEELGGWATWCITEDTELGLRLMEKGYGAMYSRERFGHGLTPDHFAGYKKQRFRWAYGAMQILKGHAREILSKRTQLTFWQKYHFVAGWLPWFADALNVIFTVTAIVWAAGVMVAPRFFPLPPDSFLIPTLALFIFKLLYSFALYANRVDCTFRQSVGASLAGLSLTYTVGRAVLYGLFTSKLPFMRTPKMDSRATIGKALAMARGEAALAGLLLLAALAIWLKLGGIDPDARLWSALLVVQSLPYAAAVWVSLVNAMEQVRQSRLLLTPEAEAPVPGERPIVQPAQ